MSDLVGSVNCHVSLYNNYIFSLSYWLKSGLSVIVLPYLAPGRRHWNVKCGGDRQLPRLVYTLTANNSWLQEDALIGHHRLGLAGLGSRPRRQRHHQPEQEFHRQVLQQSEAEGQCPHSGPSKDLLVNENISDRHLHRISPSGEWYPCSELHSRQDSAPHCATFYSLVKLGTVLFVYSTFKIEESVSIGSSELKFGPVPWLDNSASNVMVPVGLTYKISNGFKYLEIDHLVDVKLN